MNTDHLKLENLNGEYSPQVAIVLYKLPNKNNYIEGIPNSLVLAHNFLKEGNQFHLGSSTPLNLSNLDPFLKSFQKTARKRTKAKEQETQIFSFKSFIPENIHYTAQNNMRRRIIFSLKRPVRTLLFTSHLSIPDGEIKLPNLIFDYKHNTLSVYAYKDDVLTSNTELFKAPFHNTNHSVCMGNAKIVPRSIYWEDLRDVIDYSFFNSKFSALHGDNVINGNLQSTLSTCIKSSKPFPLNKLVSLDKTFESLISKES